MCHACKWYWRSVVQAVCCAGIVDAIGDCCASGTLDECGVCDGDGTSCRLTLRLLVQVPAGTNITDNFTPATEGTSSAAPWQLAVQQLLQPTLSKLSTSVQLQLQSIGAESASASLVAAAGQATETKISRDLLAVEDATAAASAVCPDDGSQSFAGRMATPDAAAYGTSACSNNCQQSAAAIVTAAAEVAAGATVATARQLLDTTNWLAAYVNVVLMPAVAPASPGASASSARNALSISVSSVGSSLVVDLEAQSISATSRLAGTSGSSSIPSGSSSPALQLLRVLMAERVGVCGNSVCEVGERPLLTPNGDLLHVATSPCPQVRVRQGVGLGQNTCCVTRHLGLQHCSSFCTQPDVTRSAVSVGVSIVIRCGELLTSLVNYGPGKTCQQGAVVQEHYPLLATCRTALCQ